MYQLYKHVANEFYSLYAYSPL